MGVSVSNIRRGVQEIGRRRMLLLGSLTAGHVVVHWYTQLLSLVLPYIKADLNLSYVQVGTITTTQQAVSGIATLPAGYLSDSFRKRGSLILAGAIISFGIALFVMGAALSHAWVLLAAGLIGLGTALWHPGAMGSLSLQFPERRGMALSIHGVGASIGDALAPITVGAIIGVVSWRLTLEFHLIPALLFALILWRGLGAVYQEQATKPSFRSYAKGIGGLFANRQVLAVMASSTLVNMARISVLTFLPIYIKEDLGYSPFALGVYLTLLYVMGMVSQPIMGIVSDREGRKAILVPSFAAMGLLFFCIPLARGSIELGLVLGALGLFFYAILNITQTAVMDVAAEGVQSSTMGVMGLFGQPFTLISPVLAGYLVTGLGISSAFWYASATSLLAALVLLPIQFKRTAAPL